jgi:hypothetical protein
LDFDPNVVMMGFILEKIPLIQLSMGYKCVSSLTTSRWGIEDKEGEGGNVLPFQSLCGPKMDM